MLEDGNRCAICETPVNRVIGRIPVYLCSSCSKEWHAELLGGVDWLHFLVGQEKQRRKRRNRLLSAGRLPRFYPIQEATIWQSDTAPYAFTLSAR